jgi:hypothetical protein
LINLSFIIADKAVPKFIPPIDRGPWKGMNTFGEIRFPKQICEDGSFLFYELIVAKSNVVSPLLFSIFCFAE